ncbi:zinc finger CCCH domain-containing protein 55-like [Henckelia pumila]|uniref:zinc finger CCCH domain-containing protein 55-like n=1 Tax=Henckelia pumila TaxID=405737 RepID=UPI003C6E7467
MDVNRGKSLLLTKMSPGFDNWRLESQCSFTHSKSTQPPYRSAAAAAAAAAPAPAPAPAPAQETVPKTTQIVPETTFGGTNSSFAGGERVEPLLQQNQKGNVGVAEVDRSKSNKIWEVHSFKFVLIEHIRQILKPFWEQGNLSKDAYKIVMKKSIDKIIASIQASKFPRSKNDHQRYISASRSKIFELVQAYVKKYQKEASILKSAYLALLLRHQDPLVTWNQDFWCCKI